MTGNTRLGFPGKGQRGIVDALPPHAFLIASGIIQYAGAAIAIGLFTALSPAAVAWWRVILAASVFLVWRQPWKDGLTRQDLWQSTVFGVAMTGMNVTFYEAIARLPLGTAVSLEFVGPVSVAVLRSRGWRPRIAAIFTMVGVASIGGIGVDLSDAGVREGLVWISVAALMWALYIVWGQRIASQRSGITNLAVGASIGSILTSPFFLWSVPVVILDPWMFAALLGVAVLSTVVPYSCEAMAMSRVTAATFALLAALLPATSALVGALIVQQIPSVGECIGLALISLAIALTSRR